MNFDNSKEKQELDLLEIGLKYQGLQSMPPRLISSTKERSKRIGLMQVMLNLNPFHELAPFSSNKNQVKILDLGFGGARSDLAITA